MSASYTNSDSFTSSSSSEDSYENELEEDEDIFNEDTEAFDEEDEENEHMKELDPRELQRHDIIKFDDLNDENNENDDDDTKSNISNPELKRKLSRNLSEHLHWKKRSNKARFLRSELEKEMESEDWIAALSTCKKILDLQAFNFEPLYHFYCGFIYEQGFNNYESAERHYRVALQLEQSNDKHIRYYARILRRLERYEQAEHVYEYGLDQHPKNHFIRYEYAYLLWLSQKYQDALSQLKYCLESRRNNGEDEDDEDEDEEHTVGENVYWLYGRICSEMEDYGRANKYLRHSIEMKPNDVGFRVDFLLYLIHNKKYKEAVKYYHVAHQLILDKYPEYVHDDEENENGHKAPYESTFSYVYLQSVYGYLLSLMGKRQRAENIFLNLLRWNKNDYFEIHFYYGMHCEFCVGDHELALKQFLSALVIESNWAITYYFLSIVLFELKQFDSSLHFLKKAFKLNPSVPAIYKNFYSFLSRISKQIEHNDQREEDVHHCAVREYKLRNWSLACMLFLRLLDLNEENTNYQHNLAMVLFYGFDNHESSEKYFRKSLKSCGSSHPDIIRHYNVLLIAQKRFEEADAYYQILFKIIEKYKLQRAEQQKEENKKYLKMCKHYQRQIAHGHAPNPPQPPRRPKEIAFNPSMSLSVDDHIGYAQVVGGEGLKIYDAAKEHLKIALKQRPNDGHIIAKYAVLLQEIGSFDLSKQYFKHSLSFIAKDVGVRYDFANLLWWMQDYNECCLQLKTCLNIINNKKQKRMSKKLSLNEEKCSILFGIILIELEEFELAKNNILRAIDLNSKNNENPLDARYIAELMLLLIKTGEYDEAFSYYEIAQRYLRDQKIYFNAVCDDWYLQCVYAMLLSATNEDNEGATKIFLNLIEDNKESPSYFIHFFYAQHLHYGYCPNYALAKEQYIAAISIEDNWAITYWHYANVLYQCKEFEAAKTFIRKAVEINCQIPLIGKNSQIQIELIEEAQQRQIEEKERALYEAKKANLNFHRRSNEMSPTPQPAVFEKKTKTKKKKKRKNDNELKNALGISKRTKSKKNKKKKRPRSHQQHRRNISRSSFSRTRSRSKIAVPPQQKKHDLYGSNSNLLSDSSLRNLHKQMNKKKKTKKKKKKKKKKMKKNRDKLTRDADKMYNARYNKMYGIKTTKKRKKKTTKIKMKKSKFEEQKHAFYTGMNAQIQSISSSQSQSKKRRKQFEEFEHAAHSSQKFSNLSFKSQPSPAQFDFDKNEQKLQMNVISKKDVSDDAIQKIQIYDEFNNNFSQYTKYQNTNSTTATLMRYNRNSGSRHSSNSKNSLNNQRTQSNDSMMSATTRSITMISATASEEYFVDNGGGNGTIMHGDEDDFDDDDDASDSKESY